MEAHLYVYSFVRRPVLLSACLTLNLDHVTSNEVMGDTIDTRIVPDVTQCYFMDVQGTII